MRAKGRLHKAGVEYQTKNLIILHRQHWAVKLFLEEKQILWHHEGVGYLRSVVQQKIWILGWRNALRSGTHDCVQCQKWARTMNLQMSDLLASGME